MYFKLFFLQNAILLDLFVLFLYNNINTYIIGLFNLEFNNKKRLYLHKWLKIYKK